MRKKEKICIAYCGPKVNDGTMNVADLGASLIAFGELVNSVNTLLNNDNSKIEIVVKSDFRRGSFEILLAMVQTFPQQFSSLFGTSYDINTISQYLDLTKKVADTCTAVGGASAFVGGGLFWLIKKLKGQKIENVVNQGKTTQITINHTTINVEKPVYNLYYDSQVREHCAELLKPLSERGIDSFETREVDNPSNRILGVAKDEFPYFQSMPDEVIETKVSTVTLSLKLKGASFDKTHVWRFFDGSNMITASIEDKDFLDKVLKRVIPFFADDTLLVEMETRQKIQNHIKPIETKNVITKVLEHHSDRSS